MKLYRDVTDKSVTDAFSALGRAVWDETRSLRQAEGPQCRLSVLSVEPYGMKHARGHERALQCITLSVLSVEPYGMKPVRQLRSARLQPPFSALGRAVWDETQANEDRDHRSVGFQCSRSSRMG